MVVVAAGNAGRDNSQSTSGYGTINAPGNDPYVITVGAMNAMGTTTRTDDKVASYSSKGPTAFDHGTRWPRPAAMVGTRPHDSAAPR